MITDKNAKKVCVFCKNEIYEEIDDFMWIENYRKGKLTDSGWGHTKCHGGFYETKVLKRIDEKIKQLMPQFAGIISKMLGGLKTT